MSHEEHQNAAHGLSWKRVRGARPKDMPCSIPQLMRTKRGREEGETLHYTLYTVFARAGQRPESASSAEAIAEFEQLIEELKADGVTLRGLYDVSAMRDNADVMVWTHGPTPEKLQAAVRKIRRTALFSATTIVWSTMGAAPRGRIHPQPCTRLCTPEGTRGMGMRVPLRAFLRLVLHESRTPRRNAQEPRHEGYRLPAGTREHCGNFRSERLRMGTRP